MIFRIMFICIIQIYIIQYAYCIYLHIKKCSSSETKKKKEVELCGLSNDRLAYISIIYMIK